MQMYDGAATSTERNKLHFVADTAPSKRRIRSTSNRKCETSLSSHPALDPEKWRHYGLRSNQIAAAAAVEENLVIDFSNQLQDHPVCRDHRVCQVL
ncbi:unnamed protein product [Ranitomeya imitator]|uniref:Uncharacterized protein n=1 Tax=Ranitomeya imitator TaxID=111125 RepID=A0ABN9M270_9NEOB|nr:unnamed protein product [Ranitomeya imitator]